VRQLVFEGKGRARWHEASEPVLPSADAALVEPVAVATCDLDAGIMRGKAAPFGTGFTLGHEGVAHIVDVGDDVRERRPGDIVAVPFQISCGTCRWCRRGLTAHCEHFPGSPAYGMGRLCGDFGGMLADRFIVPYADHMLVPVPAGVDPLALASASDNLSDAHHAVSAGLQQSPNADVLIVGGRAASIGLYAIQLARALGAAQVSYTDRDPSRLWRAEQLGARCFPWPDDDRAGRFAVTIDASGSEAGLRLALRSTDHDGVCVNVAMPFHDATLPMFDMYMDGVTLLTGRNSARAHMPAVLELVCLGAIDPTAVTDRVVDWEDADSALADPPDKLVILGPRREA